MTAFLTAYMTGWIAACLLAAGLLVRHRNDLELFQARYWRFLLQDWKVVTFGAAAIFLTVIAPYTDDPTWDYVDSAFMSVLAFVTAPWAIGTLYRGFRQHAAPARTYVAFCVWMFSASWSYDLYILLRDGVYPDTWLPNLFLSSVLYVSAGLLWNLEWNERRGVVFQFTEPYWPERDAVKRFGRIFWFGLPFVIIAAAVILPFLL